MPIFDEQVDIIYVYGLENVCKHQNKDDTDPQAEYM